MARSTRCVACVVLEGNRRQRLFVAGPGVTERDRGRATSAIGQVEAALQLGGSVTMPTSGAARSISYKMSSAVKASGGRSHRRRRPLRAQERREDVVPGKSLPIGVAGVAGP